MNRIKQLVTTAPVLRYYDPKEGLTLQCDASDTGLGAALLQKDQPIAFASRALTPCERNYAQIEKELLAVIYGLEKFHQYTFGNDTVRSKTPRIYCEETINASSKAPAAHVTPDANVRCRTDTSQRYANGAGRHA